MITERCRVRELDVSEKSAIAGVAASALVKSKAFRHSATWKHAVLVITPESAPRVWLRADFAMWLRSRHDVPELAKIVSSRAVRRGELLAVVLGEDEIAIVTLDLSGAFA